MYLTFQLQAKIFCNFLKKKSAKAPITYHIPEHSGIMRILKTQLKCQTHQGDAGLILFDNVEPEFDN